MARPIELGLILEGEDAEEFLEDIRNPKKPTKERIEMFQEAVRIYKEHPVSRSRFLLTSFMWNH